MQIASTSPVAWRAGRLAALLIAMLVAPLSADEAAGWAAIERWIERLSACRTVSGTFEEERQLRSLRRPVKKEGAFWFEKPGNVRWQLGEGRSEMIAVKKGDAVTVLQPGRREARRYTMAAVEENNRLKGLAFLRSGFPQSVDDFRRDFDVAGCRLSDGFHVVETRLRDSEARRAVRKVTFFVHDESGQMTAFRLYFRDGSTTYTKLTGLRENGAIPPGTFDVDLEGYQLVED